MKIQAYDFGRITIDGVTYYSDLKIIANKVIQNWWRKQGHNLEVADINDILEAQPEVLIIGTGYSGLMSVSKDVIEECSKRRIQLIILPTAKACEEFNLKGSGRIAFAAHLTC